MLSTACLAAGLAACGAGEAPYVSDQRLDDALSALEAAGYRDDSVIIEPASNYTGDWRVCSQDPVPGTTTEQVRLRVGELCRDGEPVDPLHGGEETFTGVITGYDFDARNEPLVVVDEAVLSLDLIRTIGDPECPETGKRFGDRAVEALTSSLPVGTPVFVVRASSSSREAFIHQLESIGDSPTPEPPVGSVNQELVSGGYWTPFKDAFSMPKKGDRRSSYLDTGSFTQAESSYAPLIADAATTARLREVRGPRVCMAEARRVIEERRAAKAAAAAAAAERRYQRWLARQQDDNTNDYYNDDDSDNDWNPPAPQVPSGEHPCLPGEIDGDGDGICAEE